MTVDRGKNNTLNGVVCKRVLNLEGDIVWDSPREPHLVDVEDILIFLGNDCIEGFLLWVEDIEKFFRDNQFRKGRWRW